MDSPDDPQSAIRDLQQSAGLPLRRIGREWALKCLFQCDVTGDDIDDEVLDEFWECNEKLTGRFGRAEQKKIIELSERLIWLVVKHRKELDDKLRELAENWSLERMAVTDRNILRIAMAELLYCDDIPPAVSMNEAIEIAKIFGSSGEETGQFVNGILDRVHKGMEGEAPE